MSQTNIKYSTTHNAFLTEHPIFVKTFSTYLFLSVPSTCTESAGTSWLCQSSNCSNVTKIN